MKNGTNENGLKTLVQRSSTYHVHCCKIVCQQCHRGLPQKSDSVPSGSGPPDLGQKSVSAFWVLSEEGGDKGRKEERQKGKKSKNKEHIERLCSTCPSTD